MGRLQIDPSLLQEQEFHDACILLVRVGTNTPQGGDTGHGGRTQLQLQNEGSTDWIIEIETDDGKKVEIESPRSITIRLGGDAEVRNLICGLEFAADALRKQSAANA